MFILTHVEDRKLAQRLPVGPGGRCRTVPTAAAILAATAVPAAANGRSRRSLPDGPGGRCRTVPAAAAGRSRWPLPDGPGGRRRTPLR